MSAIRPIAYAVCALAVQASLAGPLTPPAGAPISTAKPLAEIEPRIAVNPTNTPGDLSATYRITQPGSYYLTGNLTGEFGKRGIEIASNNVVLDLNGFTLQGVSGSSDGIGSGVGLRGLTIRNGIVREWGDGGIDFGAVRDAHIDSVHAIANAGVGIRTGDNVVLSNCTSAFNAGNGFDLSNNNAYLNCSAIDNTGIGFRAGFGSTLINCMSRSNDGTGFASTADTTFINCSSTLNGGWGFELTRSMATSCVGAANSSGGVRLLSNSTARGCSVTGSNPVGISAGTGCRVVDNTIVQATVGIEATGGDTLIQGNMVSATSTGVSVTGAGNLILANHVAAGATRFSIALSNRYGPIVNITATGASGMTGSSATSTLLSTDPHANFCY